MKVSIFLVTFSLAVFCISAYAFNTEEHVKRFFRPEHRHLLPETTSLQLLDEPRRALLPQHDESTQCLAACEKNCEKIEVEDFLTVRISISISLSLLPWLLIRIICDALRKFYSHTFL